MGDGKKLPASIRLQEEHKQLILRGYGSIQTWVDEKIRQEIEGATEAVVIKAPEEKKARKFDPSAF